MRGSRFGNGPTFASPFALMHIVHNGQSLSTGYGSNDSGEPVQQFHNLKLFDASGNYTVTTPNASTLASRALTTPQRPINTSSATAAYPNDITQNAGSTAEVAMANMLSELLGWSFLASCTGQGAAAMSVIQKGGSGNAYAAGIYEGKAFAPVSGSNPSGGNLAATSGFSSFGPACVLWTHGETDSETMCFNGVTDPTSTYTTPLVTQQSSYETDLGAIAPARPPWLPHVPLILSQPNASPPSLQGRSIVRDAMQAQANNSPQLFIMCGPKYQYPAANGFGAYHKNDYRPLGEKAAQFFAKYVAENVYAWLQGRTINPLAWAPLQVSSVSHSGTTVTITVNNPSGTQLVFDTTTVPKPHQSMFTYWGSGFGFEAWDGQFTVTGLGTTSPLTLTTSPAHGRSNGDPIVIEGVLGASFGNTNANGPNFVKVQDATHLQLYADSGLTTPIAPGAAFTTPATGLGFCPITVTATITNNTTITLTLGRTPAVGGLFVAYAEHTDQAWTQFTGAFPDRSGNLRDSDPLYQASLIQGSLSTGLVPATWSNWMCGFTQGPM